MMHTFIGVRKSLAHGTVHILVLTIAKAVVLLALRDGFIF